MGLVNQGRDILEFLFLFGIAKNAVKLLLQKRKTCLLIL